MKSRPLVEGELATRARDELLRITTNMRARPEGALEPGLCAGLAGHALVHWYAAEALDDPSQVDLARARLDAAIERLASADALEPSLYYGVAGVAWVAERLASTESDPNAEIDPLIEDAIRAAGAGEELDVISGIAGLGVYAVERQKRLGTSSLMDAVVDYFARTRDAATGVWWSLPDWLPEELRLDRTAPYFDLGVAHGIAGVLAVLSQIAAHGHEDARALLAPAARWMLAQRREDEPTLPCLVGASIVNRRAPDAWCYGDPGVAAALLLTARALRDVSLERAALEMAHAAAARSVATNAVSDSWLCHGSAGLAHLFHRIGRDANDATLLEAARHWLARSLEEPRGKDHEDSLLEGSPGKALALASALGADMSWDRFMALS